MFYSKMDCSKSEAFILPSSVADPNPDSDPPDPNVFGPPGSGFISQRYGSRSGYFYHHAKIVRKTLIPTILWLVLTFSLKNFVNAPSKSNKQKMKKKLFFVGILRVNDENSRIRSQDPDPNPDPLVSGTDPHQNVMDPQH
jgi:hypothetical protein